MLRDTHNFIPRGAKHPLLRSIITFGHRDQTFRGQDLATSCSFLSETGLCFCCQKRAPENTRSAAARHLHSLLAGDPSGRRSLGSAVCRQLLLWLYKCIPREAKHRARGSFILCRVLDERGSSTPVLAGSSAAASLARGRHCWRCRCP